VLELAASAGPLGPSGDLPERACVPDYGAAVRQPAVRAAAGVAALALAGAAVGVMFARRRHSR